MTPLKSSRFLLDKNDKRFFVLVLSHQFVLKDCFLQSSEFVVVQFFEPVQLTTIETSQDWSIKE